MPYTSKLHVLGLPVFECRSGVRADGTPGRGVARAWVAIGDVAFGVLLSVGGIAVGGVAIGGLSVGLVGVGGLAFGAFALGGAAVGIGAVGGAAFGLCAALGGLAVAGDYAEGGAAFARHASDPAASTFFASHCFFRFAALAMKGSRVLLFLPVVIALASRWRAGRQG